MTKHLEEAVRREANVMRVTHALSGNILIQLVKRSLQKEMRSSATRLIIVIWEQMVE
jgi:hypothetical protein